MENVRKTRDRRHKIQDDGIYLCFDLKYIDEVRQNEMLEKIIEIQKMIKGLQDTFRQIGFPLVSCV